MGAHEFREVLLDIADVSLKFGEKTILNNVRAQIRNVHRPGLSQGQVVGLLGPSGRGKTQLSRVLAGLQPATSGHVFVTPKQVQTSPGIMGMVMQHYPLLEHRTVIGNLLTAARLSGIDRRAATAKAMSLLERFKLADRTDCYPSQLSGGQRQRIAIAQQLLSSDNFLIMDEPFSGLDPVMKDECCNLITEVAGLDEFMTIIVITHDIDAAVAVSDTLWMLGYGEGGREAGASVVQTYDLIERGLAWRPDLRMSSQFAGCVREVTARFRGL